MTPRDTLEVFGEPIHEYGRSQAIEDGTLVDVSSWGHEAHHPQGLSVAMTRAVWSQYVAMPPRVKAQGWQSERGRAHDILWMSFLAVKGWATREAAAGRDCAAFARDGGSRRIPFIVLVKNRAGAAPPHRVRLDAHLGPGDDGAPVLTIMLPGED